MEQFKVRIQGTRPLLHHAPNGLGEKQERGKKEYIPEEEAAKVLYTNRDGRIVQPSLHVLKSMEKVASDFKSSGKKTYKAYILAGLCISPFEIPLLDADTNEEPEYEVDSKPVVVGKARVIRSRPRFDNWALDFNLDILDPMIPAQVAKEILETAGKFQGIGDYRPLYGLFSVESFEPVDDA